MRVDLAGVGPDLRQLAAATDQLLVHVPRAVGVLQSHAALEHDPVRVGGQPLQQPDHGPHHREVEPAAPHPAVARLVDLGAGHPLTQGPPSPQVPGGLDDAFAAATVPVGEEAVGPAHVPLGHDETRRGRPLQLGQDLVGRVQDGTGQLAVQVQVRALLAEEPLLVELVVEHRLVQEAEVEADAGVVGDQQRALLEQALHVHLALADHPGGGAGERRRERLHVGVQAEDHLEAVPLGQPAQPRVVQQLPPALVVLRLRVEVQVLQPVPPGRHDEELALGWDVVCQERVEPGQAGDHDLVRVVAEVTDDVLLLPLRAHHEQVGGEARGVLAVVRHHPLGAHDPVLQEDLARGDGAAHGRRAQRVEVVRVVRAQHAVGAQGGVHVLLGPVLQHVAVRRDVAVLRRPGLEHVVGVDLRVVLAQVAEQRQAGVLGLVGPFADQPDRLAVVHRAVEPGRQPGEVPAAQLGAQVVQGVGVEQVDLERGLARLERVVGRDHRCLLAPGHPARAGQGAGEEPGLAHPNVEGLGGLLGPERHPGVQDLVAELALVQQRPEVAVDAEPVPAVPGAGAGAGLVEPEPHRAGDAQSRRPALEQQLGVPQLAVPGGQPAGEAQPAVGHAEPPHVDVPVRARLPVDRERQVAAGADVGDHRCG